MAKAKVRASGARASGARSSGRGLRVDCQLKQKQLCQSNKNSDQPAPLCSLVT